MPTLFIWLNIGAAAMYTFGTLLLWPSRKNMVAWLALPPFIVSIVIPLLVVDYSADFRADEIAQFTYVNVAGAMTMLGGLLLGGALFGNWRTSRLVPMVGPGAAHDIIGRTTRLMTLCCVVLGLCFMWMGFLPLFAEDPLLAKFFRGQYRDRYMQVAFFYRFAQAFLAAILPIAIAALIEFRTRRLLLLNLLAIALFSVALTRGPAFQGLLVVVAVAVARSRPRLVMLLAALTVIYCFGSMVFYFIGLRGDSDFNLWQEIAWGAPDVKDQIQFTSAFEAAGSPISWGATFLGGLVPGNFVYNPAVFTLSIVNGTDDISEIASGGFRLNPGLFSYIAFSWIGVLLVPFISGLLSARYIKTLRTHFAGGLTSKVAALQAFLVIYTFFINFYNLAYSGLVALFAVWYTLYGLPFKQRRLEKAVAQTAATPSYRAG